MFLHRLKYLIIGLLTFAITGILTSCSSGEGKEVLSFFFDGVDDNSKTEETVDTLVAYNQEEGEFNLVTKKTPQVFYHEPYKGKGCDNCHDLKAGNKLYESQPALCYNCHDDFNSQYSVLHGPVAAGYCTACHNPHLAKNEKLLKREGQDICLYCHQKSDVFRNEMHSDIGDTNCTECHDPHGGDDRFLM